MSIAAPETPFIAIELGVLQANIARAAEKARDAGIALRPHVKTHKVIEIARMQEAAGILGITVATLGEAEVFVNAGFTDVLIAYPLWVTKAKANRIVSVLDRATLRLGIDSLRAGQQLVEYLGVRAGQLELLIEVDSGHHRSGVAPSEVGQLATELVGLGLQVTGCFTFPGHSYAPGALSTAAEDEARALAEVQEQFDKAGISDAYIRSGGSTPSLSSARSEVVTEQRPGVYVFNDAQQLELGSCDWADVALTVQATVVSKRGENVIVDAGSKALGADRAGYATGFGRVLGHPDARIVALSEHHATIDFSACESKPVLGEIISVIPNHVCNTMNLADQVYVFDRGELVDLWAVAARGKNS